MDMTNLSSKGGNLIDKEVGKMLCRQEIAFLFKTVRFPKKLKTGIRILFQNHYA